MNLTKEMGCNRDFLLTEKITSNQISFEVLITKKELMVALGVSNSFINKLMAYEGLPYFKIGRAVRFRISEISLWLQQRRPQ